MIGTKIIPLIKIGLISVLSFFLIPNLQAAAAPQSIIVFNNYVDSQNTDYSFDDRFFESIFQSKAQSLAVAKWLFERMKNEQNSQSKIKFQNLTILFFRHIPQQIFDYLSLNLRHQELDLLYEYRMTVVLERFFGLVYYSGLWRPINSKEITDLVKPVQVTTTEFIETLMDPKFKKKVIDLLLGKHDPKTLFLNLEVINASGRTDRIKVAKSLCYVFCDKNTLSKLLEKKVSAENHLELKAMNIARLYTEFDTHYLEFNYAKQLLNWLLFSKNSKVDQLTKKLILIKINSLFRDSINSAYTDERHRVERVKKLANFVQEISQQLNLILPPMPYFGGRATCQDQIERSRMLRAEHDWHQMQLLNPNGPSD